MTLSTRGRAAAWLLLAGWAAAAQAEPDLALSTLPGVIVIGSTPVAGADLNRDQVPQASHVLDAGDISRTGVANVTDAVLKNVASATVNDTEGNIFQPDILFRGFTASPVAGTPEGLAVYVNGARFNDAFGDTVNWDLIMPAAVESVNVEAANPLFGLNALGGSVNVRLKDGFSSPGESVTLYGGSYGREAAVLEAGRQDGAFGIYVAADATHDDGFRQTGTSNLYRMYTALSWRSAAADLNLGITAAHDILGNPGATPVQALAAGLSNIFTAPNSVDNNYLGLNLNGAAALSGTASIEGVGYFQQLNQSVPNGTTTEVSPCAGTTGLLCNPDGSVVTTSNGRPVTDFLKGGPYSGLSVQQLNSHAYGVSAQLSETAPLGGHDNHFVGGVSFDGSDSTFAGVALIGGFDPYSREFIGPGVIQDQPSEGVNPVRVGSTSEYYGVFATDFFEIVPSLELNLAGRFNDAEIHLSDELGGPVNGRHSYSRFNPSTGLTYRRSTLLQAYASYSESNRAPTPQELSCASAAAPCSLLNFFVGDPSLNQVVARTLEAGVRGHSESHSLQWSWNADVYRTRNSDDIVYEPTTYNPNLAFYTNAGRTQRQGVEANLLIALNRLRIAVGYAYTDATFETPLLLNSPNNPAADANGQEQVLAGDRIPGIPRQRGSLIVDYEWTPQWSAGGSVVAQSNAYRFGDEANLTQPVGGYAVIDVHAAYRPTAHVTVFALINNVLDRRYDTYGAFGPVGDVPWPNIAGGVTDPRTASPGMPIAAYGGLRLAF